jgi:RecB family exonuclease
MTVTISREQIEAEVDKVLPSESAGVVVELPEEWVKSFNAKSRSESPSSIVSYLQCPLRWFVDRHAPFERIKSPTRWTVLGTFVHRVLEVFYSEPAHLRSQKLLMETYEYAYELLEKNDTEDGLIDKSLAEDYQITLESDKYGRASVQKYMRTRSREIVEGYLDNFEPDPEEVEVISNETWVRGEINGVKIQGKIDRVIPDDEDGEIIEDYKTGKTVGITSDFKGPRVFEKTLIPAGIYAWLRMEMTRKELLPSKVTSVRLLYIGASPEPESVSINVNDNTVERIRSLISAITLDMDAMVNKDKEILAIAAPKNGDRRGYCEYCPILKDCPAWTNSDSLDDIVANYTVLKR